MITFKGGVHPPEFKELSRGKKIEKMPAPKEVIIPLSQHTGSPAKPLLGPNDKVKVGTKIGEAVGKISVPVHSSVSGTIKELRHYPHPVLPKPVLSYVIENDGEEVIDESIKKRENYLSLSNEELLNIIKEAGIVGLGGAAFPTHIKLSPPPEYKIDTLIINGAECEPFLTADERLMQERPEDIVEGARIIAKILKVSQVIFAIEENKPEAVKEIEKASRNLEGSKVVVLKTKYPQGAEKQLIKAVLDREVPRGGLPFMVGVLVQNVGTSVAIYEAVKEGKPLYERVVTITGPGIKDPKNVLVRIGTKLADVIEYAGGYKEDRVEIISGGPMMGIAQPTEDTMVIKGTSGILVLKEPEKIYPESSCIRCASCVEVCPMGLVPTELVRYAQRDKFDLAEEWGILDCMECGSCAYVCPSHIRMVQWIKYAKNEIFKKKARSGKK